MINFLLVSKNMLLSDRNLQLINDICFLCGDRCISSQTTNPHLILRCSSLEFLIQDNNSIVVIDYLDKYPSLYKDLDTAFNSLRSRFLKSV